MVKQNEALPCKCACVVCGSVCLRVKAMDNGLDIFKCGDCQLELCHPMPAQEQLDAFYRDYVDPRAADEVVLANAERNIESLKKFGLSGQSQLLDFGSGLDAFCRAGNSKRWCGYDAYTKHNDQTVLVDRKYEWVTIWGVLEHVCDPVGLLTRLKTWLQPRGHLALTTVCTQLPIPYQHKPPEHLTYWSRKAIEIALESASMEICEYRPYIMVQKSDVYLNAVLRTVPSHLRSNIYHDMPEMVEVPTNEIFVVARRHE